MPVKTRSKTAAINRLRTEKSTNEPNDFNIDWDIPDYENDKTIKTYSKKQPLRKYSTRSKTVAPESPLRNSEQSEDISRSIPPILPSSVTVRRKNKTRLQGVDYSMVVCTTLLPNLISNRTSLTVKEMSLCSNDDSQAANKITNSTALHGLEGENDVRNFIPCEISSIEGGYDNIIDSYAYEKTTDTKEQRTSGKDTAMNSVKKVWFKESEKTPKDYSANRNCEISMINECPIAKKKKKSQSTRNQHMMQDTEILLEFEPIPLECSNNIGEMSKDITPESCPSNRGPTSSAKRRLLTFQSWKDEYPDKDEYPVCILVQAKTARKYNNKKSNWVWRDPFPLSIEEIDSFPDDILI
ncbi:uncharacterized protein LOC114532452 [Dendronephthya gigantea]|uniref:uncharacterized protein LOC114532452 n=1 Tax=Dendronephthya gigantea TaxID=151771 RepID=UPI0010697DD3|nr:uncharacterized protein LOC114532452 [Dendronephthya gigantea]XP_028409760.1 uncharacterized protein LOC114532452 [Dendronephthya gigantea]